MNKLLSDEEIQKHRLLAIAIRRFGLKYYFKEKCMKFLEVLKNHPDFFWGFRDLALALRKAGVEHHSAMTLIGVMRYESALQMQSDGYKINNNYAKPLRLLLEIYDNSFVGFFKDRKRKGQQQLKIQSNGNVPFGNDC